MRYTGLLALFLLALAPSRGEAQVGLQLEVGLDGKIREGHWAPARVTASNSGEPVAGHLEVAVANTRTALPLELPTAANKRLETTLLPETRQSFFQLTPAPVMAAIRTEKREVAVTRARVQVVPEMWRLLVVCGEEAGGLRFLDGVPVAEAGWSLSLPQQGQSRWAFTTTAHPLPAAMPVQWAGLDAADLLVMRDAAWAQLQPEQRRAVRRWVEMGGRLLACGEDPAGFHDEEGRRLLPVELAGSRPRSMLTAFPLPGREPIRAEGRGASGGARVMTVAARPRPEAAVGLREAGAPIVVTRPTGFGAVLWLGFDPFRVPPRGAAGQRALWAFLIGRITGVAAPEPAFPNLSDVSAASVPVKTLPHFRTPSRWTLSSFGLVYVAVFGPLNIWMLRRLRRTVRAWLLMPVLSFGMTGGVLALGNTWGRARVVFHAASVWEAMSGSGTARELSYAALFSPVSRAFGLEISDPAPIVRFFGEEGEVEPAAGGGSSAYRPSAGPTASTPDFRDGDLSRWNRIALTLWTIQPFQVERAADLGDGVSIALNDRLAGRVTNATPHSFRDAYLQFHGWRYSVGALAPGTARAVTTAGWKRRREVAAAMQGGGGPAAREPLGLEAGGGGGFDLLTTAGSQLRGVAERPEVVLVARLPDVTPPVTVPGVARTPAPGLDEGAILVVRKAVAPTAEIAR